METYETKHAELVRRLAPGGTLLLAKDGNFPLTKPCEIALFGSGARHTEYGGRGSGEVNSRKRVSVEEGMKEAGFLVTTRGWLDRYDQIRAQAGEAFRKKIIREARAAHVSRFVYGMGAVMPEPEYDIPLVRPSETCITAVYVLSRTSGEGSDRKKVNGDVLLTKTEVRDILELNRMYPRFILVLNVGGPVDLAELTGVKNILLLSQLGAQTGTVLADLLLGNAYPSGKLTASWSASADLPGIGTFGDPDDTCYREGVYVGYRYFDTAGVRPLYPFGFGQTWTDFDVQVMDVSLGKSAQTFAPRTSLQTVTARVLVTNVGRHPGREVVQAYLSFPSEKLDQPFQALAAFVKTEEIAPGRSQEAVLSFCPSLMASYDAQERAYVLERGEYVLRIGTDSRHTVQAAALTLGKTVRVKEGGADIGDPGFEDWKPGKSPLWRDPYFEVKAGCYQRLALDPDALVWPEPEDPDAAGAGVREETEEEVRRLSDSEAAQLLMGRFDEKGGLKQSVIGNSSRRVAGASGETTDIFEAEGVPGLIMADGPAGLRLAKDYYRDEKGNAHSLAGAVPLSFLRVLPAFLRRALSRISVRKPKNRPMRHQYCTAIPIGTAIAQSFDEKAAEAFGDMVGSEMERFGVNLWLAPALNIQRSVLCGRNFEYFSEDPLVSGQIAAAITRGVNRHAGRGTVIKHFAANNQETGRYTNNSHVSARALREIYLRGFAVCVRESRPAAVMTSYNLINGVHTSESLALVTGILRGEFGFKGVVMTDWIVGGMKSGHEKYPFPDPAAVATSGNDLYMPGSKKDFSRLLEGLEAGRVSRNEVNECAARVLELMKEMG
ncbi:MAG: glycoside hydrolase family 3 N-terminal domain-containing protein [Lachnospiraceae bacterium]